MGQGVVVRLVQTTGHIAPNGLAGVVKVVVRGWV